MAIDREGTSAFERLAGHYDLRCSACGYEDGGGAWRPATAGRTVTYRHECPSCGAIDERTLRLGP